MGINIPSHTLSLSLFSWRPDKLPLSRASPLSLSLSVLLFTSLGVEVEVWILETWYWDWMGKEALPSLCPPCFEFESISYVSCLPWAKFWFSRGYSWCLWSWVVLGDLVTPCCDSNPSILELKSPGSRVLSNPRFSRSWENPFLAREFLDSSQIMEWFVDSFRGHVH